MKKSRSPQPTDAELSILQVLWAKGPSTVRTVWETLAPEQNVGYTTVLKLMQIMADKGLVKRDESARSHVYEAAFSQSRAQRDVVRRVLDRVFGGSGPRLAMQALSSAKATPQELAEIRKLLDQIERRK